LSRSHFILAALPDLKLHEARSCLLLRRVSGIGCRRDNSELAGERAARVLPAVFAVAEGCVEALAADAARSDAVVDKDTADHSGLPPVLPDR
jgi:hypothetical protein